MGYKLLAISTPRLELLILHSVTVIRVPEWFAMPMPCKI
jgi:hypothetical protein